MSTNLLVVQIFSVGLGSKSRIPFTVDEILLLRMKVQAIKGVAARLGNTPATCRKCYVHPAVLDSYPSGVVIRTARQQVEMETADARAHSGRKKSSCCVSCNTNSLSRRIKAGRLVGQHSPVVASGSVTEDGCPISRSCFARYGIPPRSPVSAPIESRAGGKKQWNPTSRETRARCGAPVLRYGIGGDPLNYLLPGVLAFAGQFLSLASQRQGPVNGRFY